MDAKITKKRLGHLLSYDWIKIIAICAAVIVVWVLLFTSLATRATKGQTFQIYVYPGVTMQSEKLGGLSDLHKDGVLSGDVLDYNVLQMTSGSAGTQLSAFLPNKEGDVMFINDTLPTKTVVDEETGEEKTEVTGKSDLEKFLTSYFGYASWLGEIGNVEVYDYNLAQESYLDNCEKYLSQFYTDEVTSENPNQDKEKIESEFRKRIKGDKRYKKESQIKKGLEEEFVRIENLRKAYTNVLDYLEQGIISVRTTTLELDEDKDKDGKNDTVEVQYAYDLSKIEHIADLMVNTKNEESGKSDDLCMIILNEKAQEEALRFEQITLLDYIVREYGDLG